MKRDRRFLEEVEIVMNENIKEEEIEKEPKVVKDYDEEINSLRK